MQSQADGRGTKRKSLRVPRITGVILLVAAACAAAFAAGSMSSASSATAATASPAAAGPILKGGRNIAGLKVVFQEANSSTNPFDVPVFSGVDAAAAMTGLKILKQFANSQSAREVQQLKTAIAQKVAGIIVSIPDPSLNKVLCDARKAGIAVIAWNVNGSTGVGRECVMAFLGQDFVTTGNVLGSRMIKDGLIKRGDKVVCPVEFPASSYAAERAAGVNKALRKIGLKCDVIGITADQATAKTRIVQYLLGHRDTDVIIGLGGTGTGNAEASAKQAGLKDVAIGGFDLSAPILSGIKNGSIHTTVDQQPYSQGFFAVMQMALYLKYGLFPSDMATGGTGLVDKSNVDLVASLVPKYR